jgi:hypothetical protein
MEGAGGEKRHTQQGSCGQYRQHSPADRARRHGLGCPFALRCQLQRAVLGRFVQPRIAFPSVHRRSLGSGRPGVKLRVPPFWLRPAITDGRVFLLNLLTNKDLFERIQTSLLTKVHHSLGTRRPFSLPGPAWNFGETAGPFDLLGGDCRLMSYKLEEASKSHTCDPLCHFFGKRLPLRCW